MGLPTGSSIRHPLLQHKGKTSKKSYREEGRAEVPESWHLKLLLWALKEAQGHHSLHCWELGPIVACCAPCCCSRERRVPLGESRVGWAHPCTCLVTWETVNMTLYRLVFPASQWSTAQVYSPCPACWTCPLCLSLSIADNPRAPWHQLRFPEKELLSLSRQTVESLYVLWAFGSLAKW